MIKYLLEDIILSILLWDSEETALHLHTRKSFVIIILTWMYHVCTIIYC